MKNSDDRMYYGVENKRDVHDGSNTSDQLQVVHSGLTRRLRFICLSDGWGMPRPLVDVEIACFL